ncbi:MAG: hypothetical protein SPL13_01280 [Clostridia bacterium]|nr:hypothetical protein [Clostridia bacterium]
MSENLNANVAEQESTYKSFPFFRILYRNLLLIICIIIASGLLGTFYGIYTQKPVYTAECDVIFTVRTSYSTNNNTSVAKMYMKTISEAITTPNVESVARSQSGDRGISRGAVSVTYTNDSMIMYVKYTDATEALAKSRLKAYITAAADELRENKPINVTDLSLKEIQNDYSVEVTSNRNTFILVGFVAGVVLGVAVAVLRYLLDNKVKDKNEIEEITGVSLLSYIDKQ